MLDYTKGELQTHHTLFTKTMSLKQHEWVRSINWKILGQGSGELS